MKTSIAIFLVVLATAYSAPRTGLKNIRRVPFFNRIVGGVEAKPHEFPWQVSLQYADGFTGRGFHICGGSVISDTYIACAGHCVDGNSPRDFQIVAGDHNLYQNEGTEQKMRIQEFKPHEHYNPSTISNDISLIKLASPLTFNKNVKAISVGTTDYPTVGAKCKNSGWGVTSDDGGHETPDKLRVVTLPILSEKDCERYWGSNFRAGEVCAGDGPNGEISPCSGDSGGPLACPDGNNGYYLAGIVSYGRIPCGQKNAPAVFTSAGYFRKWISDNMK